MVRFGKRIVKFFLGNANVRDMKVAFGHLGTRTDDTPVTVRWHETFGVTFDIEAVFSVLDVVSEAFSEFSSDGFHSIC